ncbi:MAG TPA: hypothetical protein PKD45_00180 [Flavobacteriales bacterium]|nr:hypothetical protein [Flavobacteriales bacterium]
MEHHAEVARTGNVNGSDSLILANYYAVLGVDPGFSDIHLLRQFLRRCKQVIPTGDHEALLSIRKGFEVLRYEDTRIAYYRMHRLLVRHEPLRFPKAKQWEMMQEIRNKEALAVNGTRPVVKPGKSYDSVLDDVLFCVARRDLSNLFPLGVSGLALLIAMPIVIAANGITWVSLGICALILPFAFLYLRERVKDYVTDPEVRQD